MKNIYKNREWHHWFAWYPVVLHRHLYFSSRIVWLETVDRRWVDGFFDGAIWMPGFWQYKDKRI